MSPYTSKVRIHEKYRWVGFISSGTYGRVYKAVSRKGLPGEFAIKKYTAYPQDPLRKLTLAGSSPTKKERSSSTLESRNRHVVRWHFAPNSVIRTSSTSWRSF